MRIVGLDLSFSRTGLCLLDTDNKTVDWCRKETKADVKNFVEIQRCITEILQFLSDRISTNCEIVMEEPIPNAAYSAGAYALGSCVYQRYRNQISDTYHPSLRGRIYGHKMKSKSEAVAKAQVYLKTLQNMGYKVSNKKMCHDEAEAFIYAVVYMRSVLYGYNIKERKGH